jgi:pimeloyl-ACP methyl ester carboxylesterase
MLREGSGEPLVLLHGVLNSELVWRHVAPILAEHHEVFAVTALGHRGGPEPNERPVTIELIIDAAERQLDELGLERPHLAGNSLGGWMALELARRGRARSVCALSPAGFWEEAWPERERAFKVLLAARRDARRGRRIAPILARSARFRRWAMQEACLHGDRITREQFVAASEDIIACDIAEELIQPGRAFPPLEAPCPVTVAWGAEDRLFPLPRYEERGRTLVGGAEFLVLDEVGHVPMYDDPELVAATIRATTARASSSGASLSALDS